MNFATILDAYEKTWTSRDVTYKNFDHAEEQHFVTLFRAFTQEYPNHYRREDTPGHFTGSALVVNRSFDKVLLTHHRKMNRWLQLGGHADGDHNLHAVALREAQEESGISDVTLLRFENTINPQLVLPWALPLDLDRHEIAPHKNEPMHYHYDVRYLMVADEAAQVLVSEESHDVKWFSIEDARRITDERSTHRQLDKFEWVTAQTAFTRNF